jgi:hypothetical protein
MPMPATRGKTPFGRFNRLLSISEELRPHSSRLGTALLFCPTPLRLLTMECCGSANFSVLRRQIGGSPDLQNSLCSNGGEVLEVFLGLPEFGPVCPLPLVGRNTSSTVGQDSPTALPMTIKLAAGSRVMILQLVRKQPERVPIHPATPRQAAHQ